MSVFMCPYCGIPLSQQNDLSSIRIKDGITHAIYVDLDRYLQTYEYFCPICKNRTVLINGHGEQYEKINTILLPDSLAKQFPDYIPAPIRQDYEEAYKILNLSPKASATLSRRCLQGMIHDFWNIKERNLNCEITALKDKVTPAEWQVIDALRKLGNIGAHMEKDINTIVEIDEYEAEKLLKLIELLIEKWYINRHDTEELFSNIIGISEDKQNQRKP